MKEGDKLVLRRSGSGKGVYMTIPNTRLMLITNEENFRKFCDNKQDYIPFEVVDRDIIFREINIRIGG
ncbi:MAG TPA: hypothetical protein EYP28_06935 [Methanophagales archaeon]|nr:hypothetical protein [Methanophagales archaeon]